LSDEKVIRRISRDTVPVGLNLYVIRDAMGPAGDFFREVQKQKPEQYQGIFVVSPEGKVLSSQGSEPAKPKTWTGDLLDVLETGVKAYGSVTPRKVKAVDSQPHRGVGVRSDDSIVLAVSGRWMLLGLDKRGMGKVMFDVVPLTSSQAASLSVAESPKGTTWQVPVNVVKQMHKALSPTSDKGTLVRAHEVSTASLKGTVERVDGDLAYLTFEGKLAGEHLGEFDPNKGKKSSATITLTGVGTCEVKSGKLLSITLLGDGIHRGYPPYNEAQRYGAILEWRRKK
jgi:hypothetical protein